MMETNTFVGPLNEDYSFSDSINVPLALNSPSNVIVTLQPSLHVLTTSSLSSSGGFKIFEGILNIERIIVRLK